MWGPAEDWFGWLFVAKGEGVIVVLVFVQNGKIVLCNTHTHIIMKWL